MDKSLKILNKSQMTAKAASEEDRNIQIEQSFFRQTEFKIYYVKTHGNVQLTRIAQKWSTYKLYFE